MKISAHSKAFALLLSVGLVAGCSSTGETQEDGAYGSDVGAVDQEGGSTVYSGDEQGGISSSAMTEEERMAAREQAEMEALREVRVFYFDFDTAEIKPEARDVLVAHARYLGNNPGQNVRVEGHADERGTKEYNLALGERRA
ncbi:MAG: OmpA family protein, partial [Marinobacter sp.]|nr:OmpA family protein [Marinobacter sp.]